MSQSRVRLSPLAAASVRPSGLNATENTLLTESFSVASRRGRRGSLTDHTRTVPSSPALARSRPLRLNVTNSARPWVDASIGWPSGVSAPPLVTCHSCTSPSPYPAARARPPGGRAPGWNATALMNVPGAVAAAVMVRLPGFHSSRSWLPTASIPPSGLNAMLFTGPSASRTGGGRAQFRTVPSASPVISRPPSQAREATGCGCGSDAAAARVARCQTRTWSSLLPAARPVPSGLNATVFTQFVAPVSGAAPTGRAGSLMFHSHTLSSWLPAASMVPSRLNATEVTSAAGPASGRPSSAGRRGSMTSQSRTVRSSLPAARVLPSGLNATDTTYPAAPASVATGRAWPPPVTFQSRTVSSALPPARTSPLGLNATEYTVLAAPVRPTFSAAGWAGSLTSHSCTVLAAPAAASSRPSGLNAVVYSGSRFAPTRGGARGGGGPAPQRRPARAAPAAASRPPSGLNAVVYSGSRFAATSGGPSGVGRPGWATPPSPNPPSAAAPAVRAEAPRLHHVRRVEQPRGGRGAGRFQ